MQRGTGFSGKFHQRDCPEKLWVQDVEIAWGELRREGATLKMHSRWHGFFRTNFINTIVSKNCAPKTCQSFQTLVHGTCIASLTGSKTKIAEDKFHQCDCPEKLVPTADAAYPFLLGGMDSSAYVRPPLFWRRVFSLPRRFFPVTVLLAIPLFRWCSPPPNWKPGRRTWGRYMATSLKMFNSSFCCRLCKK